MNLVVGDIVFVLDKKTHAVVPCQLIERICSTTLAGEEVKNIASTPGGKKFTLEEYDAPWFESYDSANEYLRDAALKLVESTMNKAAMVAESSFGYSILPKTDSSTKEDNSEPETLQDSTEKLNLETENVFVDIEGQRVKVSVPKEYLVNE